MTSNTTVAAQSEVETLTVALNEIYYTSTAGTPGENNYVLANWKTYTNEDAAAARNSGKLQLVHQNSTNTRLEHYFVGNDGALHPYASITTGEAGLVDYAMYEVKVTITATTSLNAGQAAAILAGRTVDASIAYSGTDSGRVKAQFLTSPAALAYNTAAYSSAVTSNVLGNSTSAQTIGYLIVWFDGGSIDSESFTNDYVNSANKQLSATVTVTLGNLSAAA